MLALALAARADALPPQFWGVVPQSSLSSEQFQRLGNGGVRSMRFSLDWSELQPQAGGAIQWGGVDATVEKAALAGMEVLPTITDAPSWAVPSARVPGRGGATAPARLPVTGAAAAGWKSLLGQAAERYGPNGTFWVTHPGVPPRPIHTWQIWNEPNFMYFVTKPNPAEYGKLVKLSYAALRSVDPEASVILAGLFARPKGARNRRTGQHKSLNWYASDFIDQMYKTTPGVKTKFQGVALHPYTIHAWELTGVIDEFRDHLKQNHDAAKGLWVTELGWSSGKASRANEFAKGPAGQARELTTAFKLLRNRQVKWKVKGVFWFSVDDIEGSCNFCDGSGLFGSGFTPKRSWFAYVRFAGGVP